MKLLLFSNSTNAGESYLEYTLPYIQDFIKDTVKKALFIPYAAVSFSYDEYLEKVKEKFLTIGYDVESIHNYEIHSFFCFC